MNNSFNSGDLKVHQFRVSEADVATFQGRTVHPVCSTYALAREMEWAGRLFVLEMITQEEEAVGTMVTVNHTSPAQIDTMLRVEASFLSADERGNVLCDMRVTTLDGIEVATGSTGQRILKKETIETLIYRSNPHK